MGVDHGGSGLLTQVKPTFMFPAVGMSLFGGLLARSVDPLFAVLYALAVGCALYTAHLVDEYVDAHVRGEEPPSVGKATTRRAAVGASVACLTLLGLLWLWGRTAAALAGLPLWGLAVLHAPFLDKHPVTVTVDYPVGIGLAIVGGYAAQRSVVPARIISIGVVFVVLLSAVKVSIDRLDHDFDQRIDKRTVPVVLGERRASVVSAALFVATTALVGWLVVLSLLHFSTLLVTPILLVAALVGLDTASERAVRRQMALVYPIAVVFFVTQCLTAGCVVSFLL